MRSVRCFLAFQRFLDILEELLNALYGAPMAFHLLFPSAGYRVVDQRELVLTPSPQARRILWCRYELGAVQIKIAFRSEGVPPPFPIRGISRRRSARARSYAVAASEAHTLVSLRTWRSSDKDRIQIGRRSTSFSHPRDIASSISASSFLRRRRKRGAYSGVVTNLAQFR